MRNCFHRLQPLISCIYFRARCVLILAANAKCLSASCISSVGMTCFHTDHVSSSSSGSTRTGGATTWTTTRAARRGSGRSRCPPAGRCAGTPGAGSTTSITTPGPPRGRGPTQRGCRTSRTGRPKGHRYKRVTKLVKMVH